MLPAPIEHLGYEWSHPKTWRQGVTCAHCQVRSVARRRPATGAKQVNWNIGRMRADNAGHYTQRELGREITDHARATGTDIQKAR